MSMRLAWLAVSRTAISLVLVFTGSLTGAHGLSSSDGIPGISVEIAVDEDHVQIDQLPKEPWVTLKVKNLTSSQLELHDSMYRVHVEGERGEPPTTRVQRQATGKLLPEEQLLREDEASLWAIPPGNISTHRFRLSYFYDLSSPGKYAAYMQVVDPATHRELRTNAVTFEVSAPAR